MKLLNQLVCMVRSDVLGDLAAVVSLVAQRIVWVSGDWRLRL